MRLRPQINTVHLAFTVFNRPEYLRAALDSWIETDLSLVQNISFQVEPSDRRTEIIDIICSFGRRLTGHAPLVVLNPVRLGVSVNPWVLFEREFQAATFVVLAEDDFIVSSDALDFLCWAAEEYRTRSHILAACCKSDASPGGLATLVKATTHFTGNIWGTWRGRWLDVLRDTWDFNMSSGPPHGWDWNIGRILAKSGLKCVIPGLSRSRHIGVFGTHTTPDGFGETVMADFIATNQDRRYFQLEDMAAMTQARCVAPS